VRGNEGEGEGEGGGGGDKGNPNNFYPYPHLVVLASLALEACLVVVSALTVDCLGFWFCLDIIMA
jgi:hypothetical protein